MAAFFFLGPGSLFVRHPSRFSQLCVPRLPPSLTGLAAGCPATCGKTGDAGAPSVNAPFYGMLLTQMALRGLPSLVKVGGTPVIV